MGSDAREKLPPEPGQAREKFLELVAELRPELHRYCARLTGSVIDGEDVVQDTLAKAYYTVSMATELPPLRPLLFRIAHNTALDRAVARTSGRSALRRAATMSRAVPSERRAIPSSGLSFTAMRRSSTRAIGRACELSLPTIADSTSFRALNGAGRVSASISRVTRPCAICASSRATSTVGPRSPDEERAP